MATASNTALNRPRGPALIPPKTPPGTTTQPPTHATFCAPLFICSVHIKIYTKNSKSAKLLPTMLVYCIRSIINTNTNSTASLLLLTSFFAADNHGKPNLLAYLSVPMTQTRFVSTQDTSTSKNSSSRWRCLPK